jgi:hypothetical protein
MAGLSASAINHIAGPGSVGLPGAQSGISRAGVNRVIGGLPISVTITIQGAQAVTEHWVAVALLTQAMAPQFTALFADFLAETAKEIHRPHILSGDTFRSITAGQSPGQPAHLFPADGGVAADVGPNTPYAPFQEFGFHHWQTGDFIINPFMIPAADAVGPLYLDAFIQLCEIAANRQNFSGHAAAGNATLNAFRGALYSYSKFLGDIQVFGSFGPLVGKSRTLALRGAQGIGDMDAVMRGAIATRVTHRFVGRFAARGVSTSISASLSGPSSGYIGSSNRLYNRIRGRAFGRGLGTGGF